MYMLSNVYVNALIRQAHPSTIWARQRPQAACITLWLHCTQMGQAAASSSMHHTVALLYENGQGNGLQQHASHCGVAVFTIHGSLVHASCLLVHAHAVSYAYDLMMFIIPAYVLLNVITCISFMHMSYDM